MFDSGLHSQFNLEHRDFTQSIINFMCKLRVWTLSDDDLIHQFFFGILGDLYENYC